MTKQDWIKKTAQASGASVQEASRIVDAAFAQIGQALAKGDELRVPHVGTFRTKKQPARTGRNPQTGEAIKIAARTKVQFSAAQALKDAVQPKKRAAKAMKGKAKAKGGK